ncbi:MAG: hypothetical protein EBZ67_12975 [Chitinophagia bacterium]|nr:hypothetical protein [Chitinophagia bacterium]
MRRIPILLPLVTCLTMHGLANVAAPGFWDAGHGSTLTPLFSSEAAAIADIQMRRELVRIDLYRSFAVVKGTYWFYNHGKASHRIHTGYPVNGSVRADPKEFVRFKDLYHLKVSVDGAPVPSYRLDRHPDTALLSRRIDGASAVEKADNWYVWTMDFPAGREVKVEVWFIVHTPATMTEGYGKLQANAFTYVLQTGSAWKDSILNGKVLVTLRDGLHDYHIRGIYPLQSCRHEGALLLYAFTGLRPAAKDDLIIWYDGEATAPGVLNADSLFRVVEAADTSILARTDLPVLDRHDFTTPMPTFVWILLGVMAGGIVLLGGLGYLLYRLVKWLIRR